MKRHLLGFLAACLMAVTAGVAYTQSVSSVRLTDTVVKGVGDIDLLKNVSPAALEALRAANGGRLVLGVDVNEAANGTEKAASQAVAVADGWLEVTLPGGVKRTYGHAGAFWTETRALVAPAGTNNRAPYYTLLGESGSSRITSNSSIQSILDSTLKIAVPDDIGNADSAVLRVRFLDPNVKLGDPEAFYEFTAGFEDLALLSPQDAAYLDVVLPTETTFRKEAPAMELSAQGTQTLADAQQAPAPAPLAWLQQPAAGSYDTVAYEDLAPVRSDFDFNDLVVAYRYQLGLNAAGLVERIEGTAYQIARGSNCRHDWTLNLPLPAGTAAAASCSTLEAAVQPPDCAIGVADGRLRWQAFRDTVSAFPASGTTAAAPVNTTAGGGFSRGPKAVFSITLATPVAPPAPDAADPWMFVRSTITAVRLADRGADGYPHALKLPLGWQPPAERKDIGLAYPELVKFVGSSGRLATDWASFPANTLVLGWNVTQWAW